MARHLARFLLAIRGRFGSRLAADPLPLASVTRTQVGAAAKFPLRHAAAIGEIAEDAARPTFQMQRVAPLLPAATIGLVGRDTPVPLAVCDQAPAKGKVALSYGGEEL